MKRHISRNDSSPAAHPDGDSTRMQTSTFPTPEALIRGLVQVARTVGVDRHDRAIAEAYLATFGPLFPDRLLHVQLLSADGNEVVRFSQVPHQLLDHEGRLRLSGESLRNLIDSMTSEATAVELTNEFVPLAAAAESGFHLPLSVDRSLDGVLTVEYPKDSYEQQRDRELLDPVVDHLAAAFRNARVYRRSESLRLHLRQVLEDANAPIVLTNRAGTIVFVNRAYCEFTGYCDGEVIGKELSSTLSPGTSECLTQPFLRALRGQSTADTELSLQRLDGKAAFVTANSAPVLNREGVIDGAMFIYRDISELRELESQIIQSEKLATLGQMAAGVVHELNNPLTSIQVYADYLQQKLRSQGHDPSDVSKIDRISQSAARILRFTRDLISYARPSDDAPIGMSLVESIEQAIGFCEHVLADRGASVQLDFPKQTFTMLGVKEQLVQVWVNLITNACQAMPSRHGALLIAVDQVATSELAVRVHDNGNGIPHSVRDRLFEPFFSTKHEGEGTGLGLSIVKSIVERHAGRIEVESDANTGTTFTIYLPCGQLSTPPQ